MDLIVRNVRLEGSAVRTDLGIDQGRIAHVSPVIEQDATIELEADGRLASPSFVDPHIHLDKVEVSELLPPNRSGTLAEAISLLHQTKRTSSVDEVAERAVRVLRRAVVAGTTYLRSHVDVDTIGGLVPLEGVLKARQQVADLCDVQVVAFPQEGIERDPGAAELMERALASGADVVGGMPHWEASPDASRRHIEMCLDLAVRTDSDVDMHIDETDDPSSRTFEMLVDAAAARDWGPRVNAGHVCAMAAWEDGYAARVIADAARVGVSVVTNPATNLLLQGREDSEPRRRGIPRVKELLAAGVTMGAGQDCVSDAFYPFGTPDQLQLALILCHAAQLSMPPEVDRALAMVRGDAASVMGIPGHAIVPGARADIVVLDAATMHDALRFQAARRWVIHDGRVVASTETSSRLDDHAVAAAWA